MRANAWEGIGKEFKIKRKSYVSSRDVRIVCPRLKFYMSSRDVRIVCPRLKFNMSSRDVRIVSPA